MLNLKRIDMRNTILVFLLAVILIIGTATTTVSVMTVKPAQPKMIYVDAFGVGTAKMSKVIRQKYQEGYTVKAVGIGEYANILVMEKY